MTTLFDFGKQNKELVQTTTIGFLPRKVLIPLSQELDFDCNSIVKEGDFVKEGQVIAEVPRDYYGAKSFGASKIHASLPGKVLEIKNCSYPNGKQGKAIEILLNGSFSRIGKPATILDWKKYSPAMLLRTISEAGVINTFSNSSYCSFELDVNKIKDVADKKLFIRLFDDDPSCQTDSILAKSQLDEILTGVYITAKVCEVDEVIIAYAFDKKNQFELSDAQKELFGSIPVFLLPVNTRYYPAGEKKELINSYIKQKRFFESKIKLQKNCFFTDSNTMIHVYNAVVLNMPVESVNVFVTGDCLQAQALLKVPIGASFKFIAEQCGGFVKQLGKIIVNGDINGIAINSIDTPVTKYIKSISFSSETDNFDKSFGICLRCGKCRAACKINLCPDLIFAKVINNAEIDEVYINATQLCSSCGVCSSVCPSKLPLAQVINLLNAECVK